MRPVKAGSFIKDDGPSTAISDFHHLVEASMEWFKYNELASSPYPSGQDAREATEKWYREHLHLTVKGPNVFQWTCTGCGTLLEVETNFLHTCMLFDYVFWEFCPKCSQALHGGTE